MSTQNDSTGQEADTRQEGRFMNALRSGVVLGDGATGSFLFDLTGRLSERGHVYEALNIENPDLVRQVHLAHLQAGATALKTNTFGANGPSLSRLGITGSVAGINRAAVRLAVESIEQYAEQERTQRSVVSPERFVLGSIGPVTGTVSIAEAYEEQLAALIGTAGIDALLLETFESLERATELVTYTRQMDGCPPIILHMSLQQDHRDGSWNIDPAEFVTKATAAGAAVVGVNCCAPWEAEAFILATKALPEVTSGAVMLSAMPNAGGFERIGHRYMSRVNPEFMGKLARTLSEEGARLIGGCCEVRDDHIREMSGFLRSRGNGTATDVKTVSAHAAKHPSAGPDQKSGNGPFSRKLFAGEFVVSVEMLPPRGTGPRQLATKAELVSTLAKSGLADAVDVTDGSRGIPLMPPGDFIQAIQHVSSRSDEGAAAFDRIEFIPHFTARDLNLMAVQSRLIGYHAVGIHNVLFVTGDPPKMSPTYPRSTAVFDLDSTRMIELTHGALNAGVDFGGQSLGRQQQPQTHFTIGTGFEPEALDAASELAKLERKLAAGADYVMTQPVFKWDELSRLDEIRKRSRVIVGVMLLTSLAHAERFAQVPGVRVPQDVFDRFAAFDDEEDQRKAGLELAVSQVHRVRDDGWSGLYLMAPAAPQLVPNVLSEL
jgi:homocysteine S-methyltransferase